MMMSSGLMVPTLLVIIPYVQLISTSHLENRCSYTIIAANEENCFAEFNLTDVFRDGLPILFELGGSKMTNLCTNKGNITACIKQAMGSCNNAYFDYKAYTSTLDTICTNQTEFRAAEMHCDFEKILDCLKNYHIAVVNLKKEPHYRTTQPTMSDICMIFEETRDCFHVNESEKCLHSNSELLTSLYRNRFTSIACDNQRKTNKQNSTSCPKSSRTLVILLYLVPLYFGYLNKQ